MKITMLGEYRCRLGEGPLWDAETASLYWLDSLGPTLFRYREDSGRVDAWPLPGQSVGSLAVRESGGLVLAMDQGFYRFDPDRPARLDCICEPLAGRGGLRFNDGKVDPFGAFVAGAMNIEAGGSENCPVYLLTPQLEAVEILDGFQCFNGPCFDTGGARLYLTGRREGAIEVYDYGSRQRPCNGRVFIEHCNPDGATLDCENYLWSAQWDDGCLLRIAPDGSVAARLDFPGAVVTSVMFGGRSLDRLFVTTLGCDYYGARPAGEICGQTLVIDDSGYRGRPETRFKG